MLEYEVAAYTEFYGEEYGFGGATTIEEEEAKRLEFLDSAWQQHTRKDPLRDT